MAATEIAVTRTGHFLETPALSSYDAVGSLQSMGFAMALAGHAPPKVARVLDLAPHAGLALLIDAASNQEIEWHAVSGPSPPEVAALARDVPLANLRISADPPPGTAPEKFDVVSHLDGWSFLPRDDQRRTLAVAGASLHQGGALRLSFAALPGHAGTAILHRLVAANLAATGTWRDEAALRAAVEATLRILDVNPAGAGQSWGERVALEHWLTTAQERSDRDDGLQWWRPLHFGDVADMMAATGLAWACPLSAADGIESLHLPQRQRTLLSAITEPDRREEVRNVLVNSRLRRDVWRRSQDGRPSGGEAIADDYRFVQTAAAEGFRFETHCMLGRMALARACYEPLLARLRRLQPTTLAELAAEVAGRMRREELGEALAILLDQQLVAVAKSDPALVERSAGTALALNAAILQATCNGASLTHLASPVTGSGIAVAPLHQLFLAARLAGETTAAGWARFAEDIARRRPPLAAVFGNLLQEAETFGVIHWPIYRALRLAN